MALVILIVASAGPAAMAADTEVGEAATATPPTASPEKTVSDAVLLNEWCPVLSDERAEAEFFVIHEGKRVNFCCAKCVRKFEEDPQAYLANLPQFAQAGNAPMTESPDESVEHSDEHEHSHAEATLEHHEPVSEPEPELGEVQGTAEMHDHAAHEHDEEGGIAKLTSWLGNFHPPSVNFPIALLMSGLIAEVMLMMSGREFFSAAARFCVWLGCLTTMPTVVLGWFFAGFKWMDGDWLLTTHRWVGTAAGAWAVVVLALCIAAYRQGEMGARWRLRYRLALVVGVTLVGLNGFFGGAMIYGLDHYAW